MLNKYSATAAIIIVADGIIMSAAAYFLSVDSWMMWANVASLMMVNVSIWLVQTGQARSFYGYSSVAFGVVLSALLTYMSSQANFAGTGTIAEDQGDVKAALLATFNANAAKLAECEADNYYGPCEGLDAAQLLITKQLSGMVGKRKIDPSALFSGMVPGISGSLLMNIVSILKALFASFIIAALGELSRSHAGTAGTGTVPTGSGNGNGNGSRSNGSRSRNGSRWFRFPFRKKTKKVKTLAKVKAADTKPVNLTRTDKVKIKQAIKELNEEKRRISVTSVRKLAGVRAEKVSFFMNGK